jgi:hypothetical protein
LIRDGKRATKNGGGAGDGPDVLPSRNPSETKMEDKPTPESAARRIEPRYAIDIAARLVVIEGKPEAVRLINLSRGGFRVATPLVLPAGHPVRLEVDGWPRLLGKVVWCDSQRIGCMFETPPSDAVYATMCRATQGEER